MEMYRDFVCSIHRMNYIVQRLFDHEMQLIDNRINFTDIMTMYYFTEENKQGEINPMSYHNYMLDCAKHLSSMGYMKIDRNNDHVILTEQGLQLKEKIDARFTNHAKNLLFKGLLFKELSHILTIMSRFEIFWSFILSIKND